MTTVRGILATLASRFSGIRARLLAANFVIVVTGIATTTVVAALVGPPMFQRLMDTAVQPGHNGDHPYQRAFARATAMSVGTALVVSAAAAMTLGWYFSRRFHRSATELSRATQAVAHGYYDIRVPPSRLGTEFDEIRTAFNMMAQRLGEVEHTRRQLLADLAHEIRTPISILEAYMEAIEDGVQPLNTETIGVLRQQAHRLTRFNVDVTRLTSAEHDTAQIYAQWISLDALVGPTVTAFQHRYQAKGVSLKYDVPSDAAPVWADAHRLAQVLANLLDNALRHTHRGDRVQVTAKTLRDKWIVQVYDTGDGVPGHHLPYLFERFYRVDAARDRDHGGAGIGLAIAKALVEAHRGQIIAASDGPGLGCSFTLTFPMPREARPFGQPLPDQAGTALRQNPG